MLDEITQRNASKKFYFMYWGEHKMENSYIIGIPITKHFTGIFHQKFLKSVFCCCHLTEFFLFDLGYTDVIKGLVRIGLLSPNQHPALHSQVFKVLR